MKRKILAISFLFMFLNSISFGYNFNNNNEKQIKKVIKNHNKAIVSRDYHLVESFYDKDYKSADGFNLEDMKKILENTQKTFKNLKSKSKINNVYAYDNWAIVQMSDKSIAKIYPYNNKKYRRKRGVLEGKSSYIVYLVKEDNTWKIIKDEILAEQTSLRYGIANKIKMDLITPIKIENNKDYDLSLKMDKPQNIVALASLSREEIGSLNKEYNEKFRKVPDDDTCLERIVKANNNNKDEYALASIGFTKVSINEEETKARIEILGMAYLMKRINMEKIGSVKKEVKAEKQVNAK